MATTEKQKILTDIIVENHRDKIGKSMYKMMLEAGYSEASAKQSTIFISGAGMQKELTPIVDELKRQRRKAIKRMAETVKNASYRDVNDAIDKLTKNIQLLGGKPTEITNDLSNKTDEELNKIAKGGSGISEKGTGEKTLD